MGYWGDESRDPYDRRSGSSGRSGHSRDYDDLRWSQPRWPPDDPPPARYGDPWDEDADTGGGRHSAERTGRHSYEPAGYEPGYQPAGDEDGIRPRWGDASFGRIDSRGPDSRGSAAGGQGTSPDIGSWSRSRERWVPDPRDPDEPDYSISRFEDTGEMPRQRLPARDRPVLDGGDWRELSGSHPRVKSPDTEPGWSRREWSRRIEPTAPPATTGRQSNGRSQSRQRRALSAAYSAPAVQRRERAPVPVPPARFDDDDEPPVYGYFGAAFATISWYTIPATLYLLWSFLLDGRPRGNCVDPLGNPCLSPRDQALHNLISNLPRIGVAIALSLVVAMLIRWITSTWRGLTVGFAATVVGAGVTTVLFSVLGNGSG